MDRETVPKCRPLNASGAERPSARARRNLLWAARMFAIGLWFAIVSFALLPVALVRFRDPRNSALFVRILSPWARRILGLKVICRGALPKDQPAVLIMNHQAALDILLNSDFYPERCVVIAKKSLAFIPVFGWFFYLAGNLLINRNRHKQSLAQLDVAVRAIERDRHWVWIFPEGTRSRGRGLGKFKKGAFHLALRTGAPIIPVVSSSYCGKLSFGRWQAGTVLVRILDPISMAQQNPTQLHELVERTENSMREAIAALDHELTLADQKDRNKLTGNGIPQVQP